MTDLPFERCADCETVCAGCRFARATRREAFLIGFLDWRAWALGMALGLAIVGIIMTITGCTVTPYPVLSHSPSLDGTNRNSGFLGFRDDGYGMLTEHAKQRYDALVRRYGSEMLVPVHEGDGLSRTNESSVWIIDPEHLADFETMGRWSISPP